MKHPLLLVVACCPAFALLCLVPGCLLVIARMGHREHGGVEVRVRDTSLPRVVAKPVRIGDDAVLDADGEKIVVCRDAKTLDRVMELAVAGDTLGIAQLAFAERIFLVPTGTPVKLIGYPNAGAAEVRITSGDFVASGGMVSSDFVKSR